MTDFAAILNAAQQLPPVERLRLIDAIWDSVPADCEPEFGAEWASEIERRVAEIDCGKVTTIPWSTIREEALARLGNGKTS